MAKTRALRLWRRCIAVLGLSCRRLEGDTAPSGPSCRCRILLLLLLLLLVRLARCLSKAISGAGVFGCVHNRFIAGRGGGGWRRSRCRHRRGTCRACKVAAQHGNLGDQAGSEAEG